ncbi:MAG TPA: hypothetical protein VN903_11735 [Polyangia bacterium]|jgi:hypothetical protein|nr:hypothetical protein [Polyangia bacterium]
MGWLRLVIRVGALWLLSIVVSVAGMELAHRMILATEGATTAQANRETASAVSLHTERDRTTIRFSARGERTGQ